MYISQEFRESWSTPSKIILRFAILFFGGFIVLMFLSSPLESFLAWIGRDILKMDGDFTITSTGSGDRTMNYVALFVQVFLTLIGTIAWSTLDRKRVSYNKLQYWFTVILRIFVSFFMLSYGMAKIFKIQFPEASLLQLLQPLGEMSPMRLAWTYMGYSEGFNIFTGGLEVIAGLFLIPRRTQTLGALLVVGVMTHVAAMNMFFDIPVKIFSVHLVLMGAYLFLADRKRFLDVFIRNKPTNSYRFYNPIQDKLYHKIIFWFKVVVLVVYFGFGSWQGYTAERTIRDKKPKPTLYGIWEAQIFVKNSDTIQPLITDEYRWRYLVRNAEGYAVVKTMTDDIKRFKFELDSTETKITMYEEDREQEANFSIEKNDTTMWLQGVLYGDTIDVRLKARDLSTFELKSRKFHWINEYPYNR